MTRLSSLGWEIKFHKFKLSRFKKEYKILNLNLFPNDNYHTNKDKPRLFFDRLLFNTRVVFLSKFIANVLRSRKNAIKGNYDTRAWALSSYEVFQLIENCGGRFEITGLNNIRQSQKPIVFISNHMSTLETMVFPCIIAPITDEATFVVKNSLVEHPFFGPIMRSRNPIVVNRKNARDDFRTVMNKGQEYLSQGRSVIIFPQSTRRVKFNPKEFNSLGVKLAKKAGVSVIPVAIKTDFWGNGKLIKDLGPIHREKPIKMKFGEPILIEGSGKEENLKIIEFISSNLNRWTK